MSYDPPGCGSEKCVPALPEPCSHYGAQDREAANSLDGFHAAPSQRHFRSFKFLDRQVLFTGIPAVPAAGNRRRVNLRKKTRERAHPCGHRPTSRVSVLLGYPVFAAPRWARGFIPSSRGWEQSTSCLRNLCGKSPIQAAWRRGKFSIEMASVSVNCSFLPGCLGQCDQGKIDRRKTVHGKGPNPAAGMRFSAPRDFIAQNPPSCFLILLVEAAKDILRRSQPLHAPPSNAPP